jgi:hypothetical protein
MCGDIDGLDGYVEKIPGEQGAEEASEIGEDDYVVAREDAEERGRVIAFG